MNVERLKFSHNQIQEIRNLASCFRLEFLNLSFNSIDSVQHLNETLGNLRVLILKKNLLRRTEGLEKLYALEMLDLSYNQIGDFTEVERIGKLPLLQDLLLEGNPIQTSPATAKNYRILVLRCCCEEDTLASLDGIPLTSSELEDQAKRREQKQHAAKAQPPSPIQAHAPTPAPSLSLSPTPAPESQPRTSSFSAAQPPSVSPRVAGERPQPTLTVPPNSPSRHPQSPPASRESSFSDAATNSRESSFDTSASPVSSGDHDDAVVVHRVKKVFSIIYYNMFFLVCQHKY